MRVLGSSADAGIEAVAGIEPLVMVERRWLRVVEMTDIVLGRIFRASRIEQFPHPGSSSTES
jgi:hypothetical protein